MSCNFYLSGGLFAGMLGKALFRWKKGRLKLCLFSLEIGKTGDEDGRWEEKPRTSREWPPKGIIFDP